MVLSDWSLTLDSLAGTVPDATCVPSMYSFAAVPSMVAVTDNHWSALATQELDCTSVSVPPDFRPTSGLRELPQLSVAKKYSVSELSLPMFHRKWKALSMLESALTSNCTVAASLPGSRFEGNLTQSPEPVLAPPERVRALSAQSESAEFCTSAAPSVAFGALLATVLPSLGFVVKS